MAVTEIEKPPYKSCAHECPTGCAIYEKRPEPCAGYFCLWLFEGRPDLIGDSKKIIGQPDAEFRSILKEEERPDKSGLLFEASGINRAESNFEKATSLSFLTVRETKPGAFESYWGQKVLKRLSKKSLIIRIYEDERRVAMGPPEKIRIFSQFLTEIRHR